MIGDAHLPPGDDQFGHRLALATRCVGELSAQKRRQFARIADDIITRAAGLLSAHVDNGTSWLVDHFRPCIAELRDADARLMPDWFLERMRVPVTREPETGSRSNRPIDPTRSESPSVESIEAMLTSSDVLTKRSGARAVCQIGAAAGTPLVLTELAMMLRDGSRNCRQAAAWGLRSIGPAAATPAALAAIEFVLRNGDGQSRMYATMAVIGMRGAAATEEFLAALEDMLRNGDPRTRCCAADTIGWIGRASATPGVLAALARALSDNQGDVRDEAIRAVAGIGSAAATPAFLAEVESMLRSGSFGVQETALQAIRRIGTAAGTSSFIGAIENLLRPRPPWRQRDVLRIGAVISVAVLLIALHIVYPMRFAIAAATALVVTAVNVIVQIECRRRYVRPVGRLLLARVIGAIGPPVATPAILAALGSMLRTPSWALVRAASETISELGSAGATPVIVRNLMKQTHNSEAGSAVCEALKALRVAGVRFRVGRVQMLPVQRIAWVTHINVLAKSC